MSPRNSSERLVLFARVPERGKVKTRLSPPLSTEQALEFHRALVDDSLERLGRISRAGMERVLYWSAEPSPPAQWSSRVQRGGDLGSRMLRAVSEALAEGVSRIAIVGSDSPTLPLHFVDEAFEALQRVDAVLGPADDGGYTLVGCRCEIPELFEGISWGSASVFEESLKRLASAGRTFERLDPWYDVDTPRDLERLRQEISFLEEHAPAEVPRRVATALGAGASA